ncbi:MAG: TolC family protein [Rudaea sp.]|nr:TolC family protein [Rudaea sp.]
MPIVASLIAFPSRAALVGLCVMLGACATYAPRPLDLHAAPKHQRDELRNAADLSERLTIGDIERLALDNNPELIAARRRRGVGQAQMRSAAILPNPVFNASYGELLSGPGTADALAAGLTQDLKSLVTLSSRRNASQHLLQAINADLLWQEWQTLGKARLLAVDIIQGDRQLELLRANAALWEGRIERERRALGRADISLSAFAPELAALADARRQRDDSERQQRSRRRDLAALLGLSPQVALELDERIELPQLDAAAVRNELPGLADRRPDLIALRLGYLAQEDRVRGAILAQFPALAFGFGGGRDTSDVRTFGPQITLDLPLFDRNQGNIAQERASREQLHAEFEARLIAAKGDVEAMLADQQTLREQLGAKKELLASMETVAASALSAYSSGDLDARGYVDLMTTRNARQQEILALQSTLLEQQIAMATLIGAGMPAATLPDVEKTQ